METTAVRPPPGTAQASCVRLERPEPGLVVLVLDPPERKIAVLDLPLMNDLARAVAALASERDLRGLVITGREPLRFAAGADLDALAAITDKEEGERLARMGQEIFASIAALTRVNKVAAVGGAVPGGAYELCLACDTIVAADHPSTRIGLPETRLGILPGWGGTQRLPRRVGVRKALGAILSGKLHTPRQALQLGLVDRLTYPEYLARISAAIAMGRMRVKRGRPVLLRYLVDRNPLVRNAIARKARETLHKQTGGHYPAAFEALRLVVAAPSTPLQSGLAAEAEALGRLAVTNVCKNLVAIFRTSEDAKRLGKDEDGESAPLPSRAAVVGAGLMGGAIASLMTEKGITVRLRDVSPAALDAAAIEHRNRIHSKLKLKRMEPHEANSSIDRLELAREAVGFGRCEIAIEAVAEKLEVKRAVFNELAAQMGPKAILATNTSSLSIESIAETVSRPERVVGMHFFNPVHQMPLVEVVRARETSEQAVRTVAKLALELGKTPVIVRDVAGFLVNRLLGPYLDEAVRLFESGVDPQRIERAALDFGMPMGPLELLDEVGFDIASHAAASLHEAYGERMAPSPVLARMLEEERLGRKNGRGFYLHEKAKVRAEKRLDPSIAKYAAPTSEATAALSGSQIADQMILAMVNEAARCLEERVVEGPSELDLAAVFGMGFPPFRGGLLRHADSLGAAEVVARLRAIAESPAMHSRKGEKARFVPAPSLLKMASSGTSFYPR